MKGKGEVGVALAGGLIGAVLCVTNLVCGLTTGFIDSGAVPATLLGALLLRRGDAVRLVEIQTVAAAAASMPAALGLLGGVSLVLTRTNGPLIALAVFGVGIAALGTYLGLSLRERLVERERLAFPTGIATAELARAIEERGAGSRGRALALAALCAAGFTVARDGRAHLVPQVVSWSALGLYLSPLALGTGILARPRVGLSVYAGGLLGWLLTARLGLASPVQPDAWLLWPGVTLITVATIALVDLATWRAALRGAGVAADRRRLAALALAAAVVILGARLAFELPLVFGALGCLCALAAAALGARTAGETDVSPVGPIGQVLLLGGALVAIAAPHALVVALIASGAAAMATQVLWSLKAGTLVGASPARQSGLQLAGAALGGLVAILAYLALVRGGHTALPAPTVQVWRATFNLAASGGAALPPRAAAAMGVAALAALVLGALGRRSPYVPSGVALGLGLLLPLPLAAALALGSVVGWLLGRGQRRQLEAEALASGLLIGEALAAMGLQLLS